MATGRTITLRLCRWCKGSRCGRMSLHVSFVNVPALRLFVNCYLPDSANIVLVTPTLASDVVVYVPVLHADGTAFVAPLSTSNLLLPVGGNASMPTFLIGSEQPCGQDR